MQEQHPRHQTGRAYARLLESIGYVVAVLGTISGIITMFQLGFAAGLGYVLGAVVSGIGLVVFSEVVIVLFNLEYNTNIIREQLTAADSALAHEGSPGLGGDRSPARKPESPD